MTEYITAIAAAAVAAGAADILAPKKWSGYIRLVVGFLILSVLLAPIAEIKKAELFPDFALEEADDSEFRESVFRELKNRVEEDIAKRLSAEFGIDAVATAEIEVGKENAIKGVKKITVKSRKKPKGAEERLKEVYGCEWVEFE